MVSNIFYFHPYLGKWSNLTNIFQMDCNHQLGRKSSPFFFLFLTFLVFRLPGLPMRWSMHHCIQLVQGRKFVWLLLPSKKLTAKGTQTSPIWKGKSSEANLLNCVQNVNIPGCTLHKISETRVWRIICFWMKLWSWWFLFWIYPQPRMPVANEGLVRDSLIKNSIILVVTVTGWGVDPILQKIIMGI